MISDKNLTNNMSFENLNVLKVIDQKFFCNIATLKGLQEKFVVLSNTL